MVDRELLEQAAKAAGIDVKFAIGKFAKHESLGLFFVDYGTSNQRSWNPLTDDGDALRLAVKLVLDIEFVWDDVPEETAIACVRVTAIGGEACVFEELGFGPSAATRRAIVRAAAEIGKAMT